MEEFFFFVVPLHLVKKLFFFSFQLSPPDPGFALFKKNETAFQMDSPI